jgi:phytoene synthase
MSTDAAYEEVLRITRREAKNFAYGIMVLPREKRRAIAAIYAYARQIDDLADGDLPPDEKRERLEAMRAGLHEEPRGAMFVALADARVRFGIPDDALSRLVDGGLQDLEQTRYATFDDLRGYCEKVAGAVGVACIAVYGSNDVERANTLGIGLQLINIMRDVAEDETLGRVYLPQDELQRFGVIGVGSTEPANSAGAGFAGAGAGMRLAYTPAFVDLMEFNAQRARVHVHEGLRLLESLDRRSALCVATFAGLYTGQLERMEANDFDVFDKSCRLSTRAKLGVVARNLL